MGGVKIGENRFREVPPGEVVPVHIINLRVLGQQTVEVGKAYLVLTIRLMDRHDDRGISQEVPLQGLAGRRGGIGLTVFLKE